MRASVSSLDLAMYLGGDDGKGILELQKANKNYDSFKVASNFFLRLRKERVDIEDNKQENGEGNDAEDGGNRAMLNAVNSGIASGRVSADPDSQQFGQGGLTANIIKMGEEIKFDEKDAGKYNATGGINQKRNNFPHMNNAQKKHSNRSLSPFNGTVSYYNAIKGYKQRSRRGSVNCENGLPNPIARLQSNNSNNNSPRAPHPAFAGHLNKKDQSNHEMPKKSKFVKKKLDQKPVVKQQQMERSPDQLDSFDDEMEQSARKKESSKQPKRESRQKQSAYKAEESKRMNPIKESMKIQKRDLMEQRHPNQESQ